MSNPIDALTVSIEEISQEAFNVMAIPNAFRSLVSNVLQAFQFSETLTQVEEVKPLPKDQLKFIQLVNQFPFTSVGEISTYVPENMAVSYIAFLDKLYPVTLYLKSLESNVIQPYALFLAQFISSPQTRSDTFSNKYDLVKLEKQREFYYKEFSKLYSSKIDSKRKVKDVIDRNADWNIVFKKLNDCIENLESIDRESINRQIKSCTDYLKIILSEIDSGNEHAVSKEMAHRIANEAYTVGKELELLASTYYRALTIRGSVENTVNQIKKALG